MHSEDKTNVNDIKLDNESQNNIILPSSLEDILSTANESMFEVIAVSDGLSAIVDGFRDNNEPGSITPAQVSMLLECLQQRLSTSIVNIMQSLSEVSETLSQH
ncbi:hypothetical protein [Shewanella sp.]|uniref:hypothetical protein n=1 Tax=Shewanella sp. TaxID=50422 RepID=UPI003566F893